MPPPPTSRPWPWRDAGGVSLLLVGDTNVQERDDPAGAFSRVLPTLHAADVRFGHLEGPLFPPSADPLRLDVPHKPFWRHSHPSTARGYAEAGFDAMGISSNVTYGAGVAESTRSTLADAGIAPCGAGASLAEARRPAVVEKADVRVGFLSYTSVFWPHGHAATDDTPGCVTVRADTYYQPPRRLPEMPGMPPTVVTTPDAGELAAMVDDVRRLQEIVDLVIVSCHWGVSRSKVVADYQRTIAHAAVDAGADVVMGHHPHVIQEIEVYGGRPVCYSMGNFAFDWFRMRHRHKEGLMVRCRIDDGRLAGVSLVPVRRRDDDNLVDILHPAREGKYVIDDLTALSESHGVTLRHDGDEVVLEGVGET